ncbi:MAG: hypothetical protein CBD58_00865 [bacterium TMED198]|nr:MAG: hypothetical protein CBD58_00865 [bacterium TMED198]
MDTATLTQFFKYCTIINFVILAVASIMVRLDLGYNLHTKLGFWMGSKEDHRQLTYSLLGYFKILAIIFSFTPYFALCCLVP